jgi:glutathione synthase/RimK-type ligase-like ATP-grasp enzyme
LDALVADALRLRDVLEDGEFPLIVRPVGSHAGFGLAKIADRGALADYLAARDEQEFFLSRFVDYASADGRFRKYRIVLIEGRAYACHMAVAGEWKVWYLNAEMALSAPHRLEEALFMQEFDQKFAVRHAAALTQMASSIGLDYVTVDCAETRDGALLVFEADNTAIVHDMDPPNVYPYKSAQMQKIFKAVQAMLIRRARRLRADAA